MTSQTHTTTDHDEFRTWVEQHDGRPASVKGTESDDTGVLRIDFPGGAGEESLNHIDRNEWFEKFEQNNLAFLYHASKSSGEVSTFFKLVER